MISILAASFLGTWSYAGFLAEPGSSPSPAPAPAAATAPVAPTAPAPMPPATPGPIAPAPALAAKSAETIRPESESPTPHREKAPATPPAAAPPPTAPRPTLYRSTDASGQTWEHPDPAYLSSFVEARNRSIAAASYAAPATYSFTSPQPARASRCYNGRCN